MIPALAGVIVILVAISTALTTHRNTEGSAAAQPVPSTSSAMSPSPLPKPAVSRSPVAVTRATMAAHLPDGAGTVYLAVRDGKRMAYFCDGKKVEAWYRGTAANGRMSLAGRNGNTMTGDFSGASASGKVTFNGRSTTFKISQVQKPSGLYRASARVRNAKVDGTWVVLPDGTRVGVLITDGVAGPAPDRNIAGAAAVIGGSSTPVVEVDVETGAGMD